MKKICTKCGVEKELEEFVKDIREESGRGASCKKCHNIVGAKYYENNTKKVLERNKKHYKKTVEKVKERHRIYKKNNPDKVKKWDKKYREKNHEQVLESTRNWRKNNPEKVTHYNHLSRHLYRRGLVTKQFIKELRANTIICEVCNTPIDKYHLDHIIPVNLGGEFIPENMRYICETCNKKRPHDYSDIDKKKIKVIIKATKKFLKDWMKSHPVQNQNWIEEYPDLWNKSVKLYDLT